MNQIYTIGHSTYDVQDFIILLKRHDIDTIVDVRSTPYSKFASQYNREILKESLKRNTISYIYMGEKLGARYKDETLLFEGGLVDFQKVQQTQYFQEGIKRLEDGIAQGYHIALMCSEKEAFDCHRFGLISEVLYKLSINILHIYPDKIVSQKELEQRLLKKYEKMLPKIDLFHPQINTAQQLKIAYRLRNKEIAYHR